VELIDNYGGVRNHSFYRLPVRSPHIHCHISHLIAVFSIAQVAGYGGLVTVIQHINDGLLLDVGDHAARFDDVDFVDTQPLRHLEFERFFQPLAVIAEYVADCFFINPNILSNTGERAAQALTLNVLNQPAGHLPLVVLVRHSLQKRLSAGLAAIATAVEHYTCTLAMDRRIHD